MNFIIIMKPINLQLEDLGPWTKITTPIVSPIKKILPINIGQNLKNRPTTTEVESQGNVKKDLINLSQEGSLAKYLKDHAITYLPAIDFINQITLKKDKNKKKTQEFYNTIKYFEETPGNEIDYESQHINHQYFPYRSPGSSFRTKNNTLSPKNVFTFKVKKMRNISYKPIESKFYVFWNQRKLVCSRNKKNDIKLPLPDGNLN